jgi:hypothetical protein
MLDRPPPLPDLRTRVGGAFVFEQSVAASSERGEAVET